MIIELPRIGEWVVGKPEFSLNKYENDAAAAAATTITTMLVLNMATEPSREDHLTFHSTKIMGYQQNEI